MISPRARLVADTAIALLAERGMRGLTHRAVDAAAGLPPGSASNLARTRAALLELTLTRLTELERDHFAGAAGAPASRGVSREDAAAGLARLLRAQLTGDRRRATVARYELALEATRRPELRVIYDEAGRGFRRIARALMAAAGSPDPDTHGVRLVAFAEGLMFDAIAGAGPEPGPDELRAAIAGYLDGVLPAPGHRPGGNEKPEDGKV
ncbi:TetR family transcriptional regulator C-terminal domain-containing protein [Actinomadura sp. 7K507]|uniref:TetR/AcrR family transcriptional regulator n=1 Tax=Actinomadura sp. 7K507 TaxID=2530365 RepID=UPI001052FDC4|nr:TetR family transcriptional regulator C-terminal domain-containing protein [Actinomadura sp. 7K507]TDC76151.1 TetR/AcrR family transcriptional regulator [Actinomadura sp. 7K507]